MDHPDFSIVPPILSVKVEDNIDVVIVRDTARRAASLLGFMPALQAQLAGAAAVLAELVLHTKTLHEINFNGIQVGERVGVRVSCDVPWLANVSAEKVKLALRFKIGDLVDEIHFEQGELPSIVLLTWQKVSQKSPVVPNPDDVQNPEPQVTDGNNHHDQFSTS
ncbi:MAG: hypothetical protein JW966_15265 [Anaerolineae bacterium]|nr:hypothetical protein [Anaerolineae bacterium]